MKSFFVNAIAKKTVALLLVLAVAVGIAIAAPLAPKAGFGDAKVYDSSYKAVKNPAEVSDGFVLRTATSKVVLSGANAEVEVEANSLLQFISIGDQSVFYLLDGRAIFTSNSPFEVRTTVTTYQGQAGTSIYVITEDEEETAYVNSGLAEATNLITKEVTEIGDGQYIDNARRGFTPTSTTKEEYWAKSTAASEEAAPEKEETPASTETASQSEEIKPAETKPAETAPVVSETVTTEAGALEHTFEYRGFRAVLRAYIGVAELEYPAFVTNEELDAAAKAAVYTFPQLTTEIAYEIVEPGFVKIYYPESYGKAEFDYAVQLLEQELAGYIDAVLGLEPEQAPQEPVAEPAETVVAGPLVKEFSHRGIEARIEAYVGECDIFYPQYVTDKEIDDAAAAAVWKYPQYTQGITYAVVEPGHAKAYYPVEYGPDEFYFAMGLLESELYAYIDELFARYAATAEPAAEPVAEQAPEAPAEPQVEKTPIETTPKAEEPVVEEPVEKKGSDFKFGASAQIIFGNGTYVDDYKSFRRLNYKVGLFYNSFSVIVDPTVEYKDFKVGLHFSVDVRSGKFVNTFKFNTNGVSGIINSVMKYFSLISCEKGDFSIKADRTTELEFKSPVFSDLKRAYATYDKLLGTMNYSIGNFKFTAFVDDLSLQAKVDGRSQYAGFRASYNFGKIEVGASAILNFKYGFSRKLFLYPALDVTIPFSIKDIGFEVEAGIAAQIRGNGAGLGKGLMAEVKLNKTSGTYVFGIGTSLSYKNYFNDLINNGPVDVIEQFRGWAIDVNVNAGINTKLFKFSGSYTIPFALKAVDRGNYRSTLVYYDVRTKNNESARITADTFNVQADVVIGKFTFSAGAVYNGLTGRLSDFVKTMIKGRGRNGENRRQAFANLVDPEISTYYALVSISFNVGPGVLEAYGRADFVRLLDINDMGIRPMTIPISAGIKYSF